MSLRKTVILMLSAVRSSVIKIPCVCVVYQPTRVVNNIQFVTSIKVRHVYAQLPSAGGHLEQRNTSTTL